MKNNPIKQQFIFWIILVNCILLSACAGNKDTVKPSMHVGSQVALTATIEAIDPASRIVTIKGPRGNAVDIKVAEDTYNFDQLEVGDIVDINYYASVAILLQPATEAGVPMVSSEKGKSQVREEQKPQGVLTEVTNIRAIVEAIDYKNRTVELRGPEGNLFPLEVDEDVKNFNNIKQGDEVLATFTEAFSYKVRPADE